MGRKEARIARKIERQVRDSEKRARLIGAVPDSKVPRASIEINDSRSARAVASPESIMQMRMAYKLFDYADRVGSWSWGQARNWCTPEAMAGSGCVVRTALAEMSNLTWSEILSQNTGTRRRRRKKHHSQSLDSICDEAQARWLEIERAEDELFRFRLGGRARLWGVREGATFFVVWWDASHKIYPTEAD